MIIVFGSILIEIDMLVKALDDSQHVEKHRMNPGGHGLYQALAAARSGKKTILATKVGEDPFTAALLQKIRFEGVVTSGIGQVKTPTGVNILFGGKPAFTSLSANLEVLPSQIPDDILRPDTIVLIQDEFSEDKNRAILERTKAHGGTTIMSASKAVSPALSQYVDYLVVPVGVDIKNFEGTPIMLKDHGCSAVVDGETVACDVQGTLHHRRAQDIFCGTFAAGLKERMEIERALRRACIAAALSAQKADEDIPMPYLDDIDEAEKTA